MKTRGYWNYENCYAEAKKYKTKSEFKKGCISAYQAARKNGWLKEMVWFEEVKKPRGYWNKENVFKEAKKYKTKKEFRKNSSSVYNVALKNGWLLEMFGEGRKPRGYWDIYENIFEETLKYKTKSEFKKYNNSAYKVALKNKWMNILFTKKVA